MLTENLSLAPASTFLFDTVSAQSGPRIEIINHIFAHFAKKDYFNTEVWQNNPCAKQVLPGVPVRAGVANHHMDAYSPSLPRYAINRAVKRKAG